MKNLIVQNVLASILCTAMLGVPSSVPTHGVLVAGVAPGAFSPTANVQRSLNARLRDLVGQEAARGMSLSNMAVPAAKPVLVDFNPASGTPELLARLEKFADENGVIVEDKICVLFNKELRIDSVSDCKVKQLLLDLLDKSKNKVGNVTFDLLPLHSISFIILTRQNFRTNKVFTYLAFSDGTFINAFSGGREDQELSQDQNTADYNRELSFWTTHEPEIEAVILKKPAPK